MGKLHLTILFLYSFIGIIFFFGTMVVWVVQELSTKKDNKVITQERINFTCFVMLSSIIFSSIIFYNLI